MKFPGKFSHFKTMQKGVKLWRLAAAACMVYVLLVAVQILPAAILRSRHGGQNRGGAVPIGEEAAARPLLEPGADDTDSLIPPDDFWNPFGLVFLTNQVIYLLTLHFIWSCLASLIPFLKGYSSTRFVGVLTAVSSLMGIGYYVLIHNSDLITKMAARTPDFIFYMHVLHALPFFLVLIEFYVTSTFEKVQFKLKSDLGLVIFHALSYFAISLLCLHFNGRWPYGFQNEMGFIQNLAVDIILFAGVLLVARGLNYANRYLSKITEPRKRALRARKIN